MARQARHRRHDARMRPLRVLPRRGPPRLPRALRGRHPRRVGGGAGRATADTHAVRVRDPRAREPRGGGAGRTRRQFAARRPRRRSYPWRPGTRARLRHHRPPLGPVRARRRRRGARRRRARRLARARPVTRRAVHLAAHRARRLAVRSVRRRDRSHEQRADAGPVGPAGEARGACGLHRALVDAEPGRLARHRAQRHHRGRHPLGLPRPGRCDRALRRRIGRARRDRQRGRRSGGRACPTRRAARRGCRTRPEGARRPANGARHDGAERHPATRVAARRSSSVPTVSSPC